MLTGFLIKAGIGAAAAGLAWGRFAIGHWRGYAPAVMVAGGAVSLDLAAWLLGFHGGVPLVDDLILLAAIIFINVQAVRERRELLRNAGQGPKS